MAGQRQLKRQRLDVSEGDSSVHKTETTAITPLVCAVCVRYLRITVLETRSPTTASMQMAEVALRCRGQVLSMEGFTAENPNGQSPLNESPDRVLKPTGKFLDYNFRVHGQSLLMLSAPKQIEVDEFSFRTASDNPSRDPTHLTINGSKDGSEWILLLDTGACLATPPQRRAWTAWLKLSEQGLAREQNVPVRPGGVQRFCCPVKPCYSFEAQTEGYLVEGKLLYHMLREHPRSQKTLELSLRMRGCEPPPRARRAAVSTAAPRHQGQGAAHTSGQQKLGATQVDRKSVV